MGPPAAVPASAGDDGSGWPLPDNPVGLRGRQSPHRGSAVQFPASAPSRSYQHQRPL